MLNNISEMENKLLNRLVGLVIFLFILSGVAFYFQDKLSIILQSSIFVVFIILFGITIAAKSTQIYTNQRPVYWLLLLCLLVFLISIKFALFALVILLGSVLLKKAIKYIQTATMLITAIVFVLLASILISFNYFQTSNWNAILTNIINLQSISITDFISLLAIAFCFYASSLIGYWLVKNDWLSNYHFKYNTLKLYAKIGFLVLIAWVFLHLVGFYELFVNNKIGTIIVVLDSYTIQFLLTFLVLFITIWNENSYLGIRINRFIESVGSKWKISSLLLTLVFMLIKHFYRLI